MRVLVYSLIGSLVAVGSVVAQKYPNIAPTDPLTPAEELKTFKLPQGFEAQLVASDPDIHKPIQIAFDAKGRLWATTSEEYPFPAVGRPGKDRLYVMEDFGADGKAKKVSVFADDLNIPIGVLPLPDCKSVIVSSIEPAPNDKVDPICWIWKLTDTDGDGKADKKEKLYGPFGCEDTHGMNNSYTLMPDGWVYACHGFKNDSRPKGKDGHEIHMNSGNTFRFRPDGSRIEIWTHGQVNPFGIAVDPYFNLYTADCHSKPITQLIRGATYQSFTKPHDGLGFAPHVTIHGHESTALCGLVYYAADHFPKEYLDCMFLGNVTSNCINMDKIEFKGSTPVGIDKGQFLSSSDLWFRPTDIKLGPDGALYFADFYNKIIGHYEVPRTHPDRDKRRGRVWRIIYRGADGKGEAPKIPGDLTKMTEENLASQLVAPNLAVRIAAMTEAIHRPNLNITTLAKNLATGATVHHRVACTWIASALKSDELFDAQDSVKVRDEDAIMQFYMTHDVRSLALAGNVAAFRKLLHLALSQPYPVVKRAVLEQIAEIKSAEDMKALIRLMSRIDRSDSHLWHSCQVAIRQIATDLGTFDILEKGENWSPAEVKTLSGIATSVPNAAAATFLMNHLKELSTDGGRLPINVEHIARYSADPAAVFDFVKNFKPDDLKQSIILLNAYQQGIQKADKRASAEAKALAEKLCVPALASTDATTIQACFDLATVHKIDSVREPIIKFAEDKKRPDAQRSAAITALNTIDGGKALPTLAKLLNDDSQPIVLREKAAQLLAGRNQDVAFDELVKSLQTVPARLQTVIAVGMASSKKGSESLLKAIETGKASARLLQDGLVQLRLSERKIDKLGERIAVLTKGLPTADERFLKLMVSRRNSFAKSKPDATLGKQAFTKNCAACHQIGNEGNKIGPQLDGIGGRGLDRLLEDILDPNRNVDAAFRTTIVTLTNGQNIGGLVLREEGEILVMADDKGKEVKIAKKDIDEKRAVLMSPMPANLSEAIPEKEFLDLLAYLLSQKPK